jgi:hypothetical protein
MKKYMVLVICLIVVSVGYCQESLNWYTLSEPVGPGGSTVPYNSGDISLGAMVQLIEGTQVAPIASGNGVAAPDSLVAWSGCGYGAFDATFNVVDTLANYGLTTTDSIYVRVWDRVTSGGGNLPTAQFYAGYGWGAMYYQYTPAVISSLPKSGDEDQYEVPAITSGSWSFLAIPEPGTIALGLLGLGALITRRFLRK